MLLKLNRPRRLRSHIHHDSVHPTNLINNPAHHRLQHIKRDLRRLRCHKVNRLDRTDGNRIIIGTFITHDTNGPHVGKGGKVLVRCPGRLFSVFLFVCFDRIVHFFTVDIIGILHDPQLKSRRKSVRSSVKNLSVYLKKKQRRSALSISLHRVPSILM